MKNKVLVSLSAVLTAFILLDAPLQAKAVALTQAQAATQPKLSEAEAQALNAINAAPDPAAKLTAAEEFVKKYPKSPAMSRLAELLAIEISKVADANQKLALVDRFEKDFTDARALAIVQSAKLDAYVAANRMDDAFTLAAALLAKDPEDLHALILMTFSGTDEAKKGNGKHLTQTQQYGAKAIELIEADKKPANMEETAWLNHKAALPLLYQQTGILALMAKNPEDAKARLSKSIALKPDDPSSHAILAYLVNDQYVQLATTYKTMPEGKQKEEMLKKLEGMIDEIVDGYAHAVALSTGKPEYQPLLQQVMPDLTSYYKFRHNQSVEGLQQLIDKYKAQPKP
jgi:hypothetical protein